MAYYGTTYQQMLQAVENYYGAGSDQWFTMLQWTGYRSTEVAAILKQTPGINTVVNEAGELVGYSMESAASTMTAAEAAAAEAAAAINSNAITSQAATATMTIPANATTIGGAAGTVEMTSGAASVATGSKVATIAGHVGTWVIGAGVGTKLGVWIDGALYESGLANIWDPENAWAYNPQNWKDSKITNWLYDFSGYDDFMCHFNTEDNQLYVDENVFALMAQYLAASGFFADATSYVDRGELPDSFFASPNTLPGAVLYCGLPFSVYINGTETQFTLTQGDPTKVKFCLYSYDNGEHYNFMFASDEPFTYHAYIPSSGIQWDAAGNHFVSPDDRDYYYRSTTYGGLGSEYICNKLPLQFFLNANFEDIAKLLVFGHVTTASEIPGVHPYDTMPTGITPEMSLEDLLTLLKAQFPDIWADAIKQGTLNDDGTITDRVYVPIAVPTGGPEGQPETDPDHPGEVDPDNEVQTQIIMNIVNPTPNPTEEPDDRGEGETPTVIPPTGTASALYKIYNPVVSEITSFGAWLWSPNFVDQLLKMFNDPMQAIISLHKIYATPHIGGRSNIKVGYLDSGVMSNWVDEQYIDVDCGTIKILEKNASVLDYAPFVDIRLYLPFVGIVTLDVADVMRATVGVKYRIDVITGTLIATVSVTRDAGAGGVIYQYTGNMAENYPLSSGSYMGILTGILGIAAGVAGTIATGGAAAPALLGGAAGLTAMHTKIEHSNGFSGNAGALGCKKPYVIISRSQSALSNGVGMNSGWPANMLVVLSQCSGYTRVKAAHLTGIDGATDTELNEIEDLLKNGVII